MRNYFSTTLLGPIAIALFGLLVAVTMTLRAGAAGSNGDDPTSRSDERPALGDLMTIAQLRHFKLGYAHRVGNWKLADYELQKLEEVMTRTARLYPTAAAVAQAGLIKEKTDPAIAELRRAIADQDTPRFKAAYVTVTDACNQCHSAAKVGFITIRVPTNSPFSNQVFDPSE